MDEVDALSKAIELGGSRWGTILPSFWWDLEGSEWHVTFDSEVTFRFRQSDGEFIDEANGLNAVAAFRIAKIHAIREGALWAPAFSLGRRAGEWHVGARQSQLGGQITIIVADDGSVRSMFVNPK